MTIEVKELSGNELEKVVATVQAGFDLVEKKRLELSRLGALSIGTKIEKAEEISTLCLAMSKESWRLTLHTLHTLHEIKSQLDEHEKALEPVKELMLLGADNG